MISKSKNYKIDGFTSHYFKTRFLACRQNKNFINPKYFCDGIVDCFDESGEENCTIEDKFLCESDERIISVRLVCDYYEDCKDGSDEKNCRKV